MINKKSPTVTPNLLEPLVTPSEFMDRLTDFLGDSEGMTAEEVKQELREEGIDIDALTIKVKKMIKEKIMVAKYEQHPMETKAREDIKKTIDETIEQEKCFLDFMDIIFEGKKDNFDLSDMRFAFRNGWASGKLKR